MSFWLIASVAFKLCVYLTGASAIGGIASLTLAGSIVARDGVIRVPGYRGTLACCLLGLGASSVYFFVRVGDFAGRGIGGMFDPVFMRILWDSPVGNALQNRLFGFLLLIALLATYPSQSSGWRVWQRSVLALLYLAGTSTLALSFSFTGHSAELGVIASVAVTVHVLTALWWFGSLYPLWRATSVLDARALQDVLHRFGVIAAGFLFTMVLAGGTLLYVLLFTQAEAVSALYAAALILKLTLVTSLFFIAALHKWRTVPRLLLAGGVASFRRSLGWEIGVMLAVLAVTAIFSTVIGPFAV